MCYRTWTGAGIYNLVESTSSRWQRREAEQELFKFVKTLVGTTSGLEIRKIVGRTSTMRMGITMTTEPRTIVSDNVFIDNDGVMFSPSSTSTATLAAVTYVASVATSVRLGRLECLDFAFRRVFDALPDDRLWLLASQSAWQSDTIRMRRLKLWRWLENAGMKVPARAQGVELARADLRGVRWFSVAEVAGEELAIAHDIVSTEQASFLVAAPEPPVLEDYLAAGWADGHPGDMTFWRDMALMTSRDGHLLFRPFGNFDDREVGVNVIGAPETVAMLKEDARSRI